MTECLTCPQPENYAAVALQLQHTALQAEACLFDLERRLRAATNRPTTVLTSTATQTIDANTLTDLGTGGMTVNFNNIPATSLSTPVTSLTNLGPNLPVGVYEVGVSLNAIATGAVDDNSLRFIRIRTKKAGTPVNAPEDFLSEETIYEPNNGNGSDMTLITTVTLNGSQELFFSFQHTNVSSTINISIGATFWWARLSDQVALRTV